MASRSQRLKVDGKIGQLGMIEVTDVRRETPSRMTDDLDYGFAESEREGFPWPTSAAKARRPSASARAR
jgi:hypothetical protein